MSKVPRFAQDVPFVPVNWGDRDVIVGRLMGILEAVMPEGSQLEATKRLVKSDLSEFFSAMFDNQFEILTNLEIYDDDSSTVNGRGESRMPYFKAIWETAQSLHNSTNRD